MILCCNSKGFPAETKSPVVALGNFDGAHLGHQELIRRARHEVARRNGTCVAYTFDPHPVRVLAPRQCPPLLQTQDQKLNALEKMGVDICVIESFTHDFSKLDAESFFRTILLDRISAAAIVTGYDFTFGMHRHGTVETLEELGKEYGVSILTVEAQFAGETLISSTNIRKMIFEGDVVTAGTLLGRPYAIGGVVISGRGFGRRLRAHTANIQTTNEVIPKDGVYITKTRAWERAKAPTANPESYPSITSIGNNPTFPGGDFVIETHLLDIEMNILGWNLEIEFLKRTRDQIAFNSPEDLSDRIQMDMEEARKYHN